MNFYPTREPALVLRALSALAALVVGLGVSPLLTENTTQAIIAVVAAGFGVWQAFRVRPVAPSVFAALITTTVAALAAFDLVHVSEQNLALLVAAAEGLLALWLRPQSTPVAAPGDVQATVG